MIGFEDFTTDRHSGRPQPHISWVVERFTNWMAWAFVGMLLCGAVASYLKLEEMEGSAILALTAAVMAGIARWRQTMLAKKLATNRDAVAAYEAMLIKLANDHDH